ncbi:co-chaperone GroES [Patescibacteria group bacterium]
MREKNKMVKTKPVTPKLKPTAGYALIEPVQLEKRTAAGIVLPDSHDEKSQKGKVVAMGKNPTNEKGIEQVPEFKVNDTVVYKKWGGDEVKLDITGKEFTFVKFDDVLAILG